MNKQSGSLGKTFLLDAQTLCTTLEQPQADLRRVIEMFEEGDEIYPDQCQYIREKLIAIQREFKQFDLSASTSLGVINLLQAIPTVALSTIDKQLDALLIDVDLYQAICRKVTRQAFQQKHTVWKALERLVQDIDGFIQQMIRVLEQQARSEGSLSPLHQVQSGVPEHITTTFMDTTGGRGTSNFAFFCDGCGASNRIGANFCLVCGQSFTTGALPLSQTGLLPLQCMLNWRYRVLDVCGCGGFGAVYKAADVHFGDRLVAIKEMSQKDLSQEELGDATAAFRQEALLLAGLMHPHLPSIYEQFTDRGRCYLVMDYIEGETLEAVLKKYGNTLPVSSVLSIALQLCSALEYLHTRQPPIIFRDMKPSNVMIDKSGHVYLIDFGIARFFKPGQAKDTTALGSSGYAAPEQYGQAQTTPRADIYSLGATLHRMLSGDDPMMSPFHFAPLSFPDQPVLARLGKLVMCMLNLDSNQRPASIAVVKGELQRLAGWCATSLPQGSLITGDLQGMGVMSSVVLYNQLATRQIDPYTWQAFLPEITSMWAQGRTEQEAKQNWLTEYNQPELQTLFKLVLKESMPH